MRQLGGSSAHPLPAWLADADDQTAPVHLSHSLAVLVQFSFDFFFIDVYVSVCDCTEWHHLAKGRFLVLLNDLSPLLVDITYHRLVEGAVFEPVPLLTCCQGVDFDDLESGRDSGEPLIFF